MIILLDMRYAEKTILWYTEAKNFPRKNASAVVLCPPSRHFTCTFIILTTDPFVYKIYKCLPASWK